MFGNNELTSVGIHTPAYQCSNQHMEIFETRIRRLVKLIADDFGGNRAAFARHVGMKPPQVSRWLNNNQGAKRPAINEKSAREIEHKCFKPEGWLDTDNPLPVLSETAIKIAELVSTLPSVQQAHLLHLIETTMEMHRQASMAAKQIPLTDQSA